MLIVGQPQPASFSCPKPLHNIHPTQPRSTLHSPSTSICQQLPSSHTVLINSLPVFKPSQYSLILSPHKHLSIPALLLISSFLTLSIHDTPTKLLKHLISRMLALITKFNAQAGHPECPRRQCVGLHSEGSHVRCSLSAASLAICSPHFTVQYVELRGYCQGLLQPQAWVSADGVLKDCVIKVYLGYRILMKN